MDLLVNRVASRWRTMLTWSWEAQVSHSEPEIVSTPGKRAEEPEELQLSL